MNPWTSDSTLSEWMDGWMCFCTEPRDTPATWVYKSLSGFSLSLFLRKKKKCPGMQQIWNHIHKAFLLATKMSPNGVITSCSPNQQEVYLPLKKRRRKSTFFLRFFSNSRCSEEPTRKRFPVRQSRAKDPSKRRNWHFWEVEALYESQTRARSAIYFKTSGINWQLSRVSGKIQSYSF